MASPYLPTEQAVAQSSPEVLGIERQRKLADLLTAQGFNQPQGQMISGHYVAPSFTQQLAPLANVLAGNAISGRADVKQQELASALRGKQAAEIEKYGELEAKDKAAALRYALSTDNPTLRDIAKEELKGIKLGKGDVFTRTSLSGGTTKLEGNPDLPDSIQYAISIGQLPQNPATWSPQQAALARQIVESKAKAGAGSVSLSTEKSYGTNLAEGFSKKDIGLADSADAGVNTLTNINNQRQILNSGKFFSGPTANVQQELANYGNALGVSGKDAVEKAANTQSLISGAAGITLDSIKGSGLGAGQGFTDKDLQFLQDARSFKVVWNKESIERVLNLQEKAAKANIQKWNTRLDQIPKSASQPLGLQPIQVPTFNNQPTGNAAPGSPKQPSAVRSQADAILSGGK